MRRADPEVAALRARLAELEVMAAEAEADLARARAHGPHVASHRRELRRWWREAFKRGRPWVDDPAHLFEHKLEAYRWARSHGYDHPAVHGVWEHVEHIPWDDLPDAVTVKGAFGHTSRTVLPIRRVDGGWRTLTEDVVRTSAELAARLTEHETADPRFHGPYFAEELLTADDDPDAKPFEVKSWTYDGVIGFGVTRLSEDHHATRTARFRYWDDLGRPIPPVYRGGTSDPAVPVPATVAEVVEAFRTLSLAARRPMSRVDLYVCRGAVVFGELTVLPGPRSMLVPDLDERLGREWERAEQRIARSLAEGRGLAPEWGPRPATLLRSPAWLGGIAGYE